MEITAVRPLVSLTLDDYNIDSRLRKRLQTAEGILVAGSPGAGKSTFSAALANYYLERDKVVKTLESVRDLQVKPEITQYTKLEGSLENSADVLLLVRPDYTIFDEVRTTKDFEIYADFRLSGVGMIGVVHSSSAIDAIQRFIGRIELGMLPAIIDTIIFIEGGDISNVLILKMTVKVPQGFRDKDLARPVVDVRDYITGQLAYEIYSFGQDVVIVPINPIKPKRGKKLSEIPYKKKKSKKKLIELDIKIDKKKIIIQAEPQYASQNIEVFAENELIFAGSLSRSSEINLSLSNKEGRRILKEIDRNKKIFAMGHSFGGLISLIYAINHPALAGVLVTSPELGLVLESLFGKKVAKKLAKSISKLAPNRIIDIEVDQNQLTSDLKILRKYIADKRKLNQITVKTIAEMNNSMKWAMDNASKLICPVFILQAGSDKIADKAKTKEFFDGIKSKDKLYKEYDGFLHDLLHEKGRNYVYQDMYVWLEKHL